MRNLMILRPGSGLCNRMQALASGLALAKDLNRKCIIIWLVTNDLNARYEDLFEPLPYKMITMHLGTKIFSFTHMLLRKLLFYVDDFLPDGTNVGAYFERWKGRLRNGHILYIASGENITRTTKGFDIFRIAPTVLSRNEINTEGCIGIHIRRTDNEWSKEKSPTILFEQAIEKELQKNPSQLFFLATDDPAEEKHLQLKFPNNIIVRKKLSFGRDSVDGMQDAVLDLYNLSRCKKIYGCHRSSFSRVASYWGECELEILTII